MAAHFLLRLVEGKRHGFTVGGASFVGALVVWPVAQLVTAVSPQEATLPLLPLFPAVGIAYTLGESVGRLAYISFGCCYGKPVRQTGRLWARISRPIAFRFTGDTRKAVFAGGLEGVPVVPIQAISAVVLAVLFLVSTGLFLNARFAAALLVAVGGSQLWRVLAETARIDYPRRGRLTPYQRFAFANAALGLVAVWLIPAPAVTANLTGGLTSLWSPTPLAGRLFRDGAQHPDGFVVRVRRPIRPRPTPG